MSVASITELVVKVLLYAVDSIGLYKLYTKLNEKGWIAFIPFYNEIVMFKNVYNVKAFWIYTICDLLCAIALGFEGTVAAIIAIALAVVVVVYQVKYAKNFAAAFGQGKGFAVLTFLAPAAVYLYCGFSNKVAYIGNKSEAAAEKEL